MGTGKTTVGRTVALRMNYRLIDSDVEIERQAAVQEDMRRLLRRLSDHREKQL